MRGVKPSMKIDKAALAKAPKAPAWFTAHAKTEWKRIMPLLIERKILTDADMGSVENYCIAIGKVREVETLLQATTDDTATYAKLFRIQDKAMQTARQLAAELGLTPVSRSRPTIREDDIEDPWDV